MKIRRMHDEDILEASKVHQEVFSRQTLSEEWIRCNFRAFPRIRYFIADDGGSILGYVQWMEKSGFRKEVVLELEQIAVRPSRQNCGVGSALIIQSLKMIQEELKHREALIKRILISTRTDNEAQKLYKKLLHAKPEAVISNLYSSDEVLLIARNPVID